MHDAFIELGPDAAGADEVAPALQIQAGKLAAPQGRVPCCIMLCLHNQRLGLWLLPTCMSEFINDLSQMLSLFRSLRTVQDVRMQPHPW